MRSVHTEHSPRGGFVNSLLRRAMPLALVALAGARSAGQPLPDDAGGLLPPSSYPKPADPPAPSAPKALPPEPAPSTPTSPPDAPEPAPPAEVEVELFFKDGRRVQGLLGSQDDATVTIVVSGIATPFRRDDIASVRTVPSVEEQYAKLRRAIDDRDFDARLRMADWLRERERYKLAISELDGVMQLAPGFIEAADMKRLIEEEERLAAARKPARAAANPAPPRATARSEFPTLSERDINLIRVMEIDLESNPRVLIPRDTITALLDRYMGREGIPSTREGRDAFYRKPANEILATMFALRAREFYPHVTVQDMPPSLRLFRESVHRNWLINSCATTACHGGDDAGRLYLDNRHGNADRAVYTNFYILDRFSVSGGAKLIDYADPARSPLLQAGLPRDVSLFKHPDVRVGPTRAIWKPVFESSNDPRFRAAVEWIGAMFQPRPDYPIDYAPPFTRKLRPPDTAPDAGAAPATPR